MSILSLQEALQKLQDAEKAKQELNARMAATKCNKFWKPRSISVDPLPMFISHRGFGAFATSDITLTMLGDGDKRKNDKTEEGEKEKETVIKEDTGTKIEKEGQNNNNGDKTNEGAEHNKESENALEVMEELTDNSVVYCTKINIGAE